MDYCQECGAEFSDDALGSPPASSCADHSRWARRRGIDVAPEHDEDADRYLEEERQRPRTKPGRLPAPERLALGSIGVICEFFQVEALSDAEREIHGLPDDQADDLAERIRDRLDETYWHLHARHGRSDDIVADDTVSLSAGLTDKDTRRRQFKYHMLYSPRLAVPDPGYRWADIRENGHGTALGDIYADLLPLDALARQGGLFLLPPADLLQPRVSFYGMKEPIAFDTLRSLGTDLPDLIFEDQILRAQALTLHHLDEDAHDDTDFLEHLALNGLLDGKIADLMHDRYPDASGDELARAVQMGVLMRDTGLVPATQNRWVARHLAGTPIAQRNGGVREIHGLPMFAGVGALDLLRLREDADLTARIRALTSAALAGDDVQGAVTELSKDLRKRARRSSVFAGAGAFLAGIAVSALSAPFLTPIGAWGAAAATQTASEAISRTTEHRTRRISAVAAGRARVATAQTILRELTMSVGD